MGLDDRDWYRAAIKEKEAQQAHRNAQPPTPQPPRSLYVRPALMQPPKPRSNERRNSTIRFIVWTAIFAAVFRVLQHLLLPHSF